MTGSPTGLALGHVPKLHAYTPGLQPFGPGWVKLNTNECPYPPSPKVAEAVVREVGPDGASLRLYPDPTSSGLRAVVAKMHGLTPAHVCIGNGSDDILNLIVRCYCGPEAVAGFTVPSYSLYPVLVGIQNGGTRRIQLDRTMTLPVAEIVASGAKAFFLTSPNAPTGVGFASADIERILQGFEGLLIVDEAYAPFAAENAVGLLARYPRLVVVRTLSKAYALAGIRVGYSLADPEVTGILDRARDSYNVSRLSQVAALAALSDPGYYSAVVEKVKHTRDYYAGIWSGERKWFTFPSSSNFICTEPRDSQGRSGPAVAKAAYDFLYSRKVLVRHFPSDALTASFLRISVGSDDEMLVLDETLDAWLKAPPNA
ncbi:MAG TPA: histidinol-phosphate transaminase [Opitutaceae bacterium]|jgi:histidinol-phosphate aminotransferase|nr:histidinol-phosphate transaminase [Opitutaceae bacterium]